MIWCCWVKWISSNAGILDADDRRKRDYPRSPGVSCDTMICEGTGRNDVPYFPFPINVFTLYDTMVFTSEDVNCASKRETDRENIERANDGGAFDHLLRFSV